MKHIAFLLIVVLLVPTTIWVACASARARTWLLTILLCASAFDDVANINFWSHELYRGSERGMEVSLVDLIAWSMIAALFLLRPRQIKYVPYNSLWMLLLFVCTCISSIDAPIPLYAAFVIFKLLKLYLLYWCVVNYLMLEGSFEAVWRALVVLGFIVAITTFQQKYLGGVYRTTGPFDHPNVVPSYLHPLIPMALAWSIALPSSERWRQALTLLAAFGMIFAVISTQSRAGQALIALYAPLIIVMTVRRMPSPWGRKLARITLIVLALGAAMAADSVINRFRYAPASSAIVRQELNVAAYRMIAEDPWFGKGLNQFSHLLTTNPSYRAGAQALSTTRQGSVVHHVYLLISAEMGLVGLLVFAVVMARFMILFLRFAWRRYSMESTLLFAGAIGIAAVHATGFLEWTLRISSVGNQFVIMTAVCVALAMRVRQTPAGAPAGALSVARRGSQSR